MAKIKNGAAILTEEASDSEDDDMTSMVSRRKRPGSRGRNSRTAADVTSDRPQPMAHVGFSGSRHLIPERMPSARRETTVGLRIIDLNEETVENIKSLSTTLRRLDLSSLHLIRLTEDFVASLESLERLDLSYNDITEEAFPANFQKLKHLRELNLHYNKLVAIPKVVKRLKDLTRLKVGHNRLYNTDGIDRLKRLQILMLEDNSIEYLPRELLSNLRKLEIFHCANNSIREIHPDIRYLRQLKDLDLAGNKLTSLPPEVFLLPRLEVLNASSNRISRIPTINVKGRLNRRLASVDLSDNAMVKFPEHLLAMTDKLDLCKNRIKTIPVSVLKKLDVASEQELMITENPLVSPPADICECGIRSMVQYFQEAKADLKVYQGIKVLVVGASGSGKTSLVQSLVDQQSRVTSQGETTVGVDMYEIDHELTTMEQHDKADTELPESHDADLDGSKVTISKTMQMSLWDFSGHPQYLYPHYHFLHDPSLVLLVFNMATYTDADFKQTIGSWLNWIVTKTNKLVILPVGTMADLVTSSQADEICESVLHLIDVYIKDYKESIELEIRKIESMPHISTVLSDQLKAYIHLLKVQTHVSDAVVPVSAQEYSGIDTLLAAIENMALKPEIFPNVMRVIPSLWSEVENYVEEKGWSMAIPYVHWDDYRDEITKKFGMKHLVPQITHYLHDIGKVIWYSDNQELKQFVFLRPSWLSDVMKQLFRHNVAEMDYHMEESFKQNNILLERFNKIIHQIKKEGIVDRDFLRGAWAGLVNPESTRSIVEVIIVLLEFFEIGYPVVKPGNKSVSMADSVTPRRRKSRSNIERSQSTNSITSTSGDVERMSAQTPIRERPESRSGRADSQQALLPIDGEADRKKTQDKKDDAPSLPKISKVVVPWIPNEQTSDAFLKEYRAYELNPAIVALYKFPTYTPPGFFETMCVRALKEQNNFAVLHNWRDNLYAKHVEKPCRLRLTREHDDSGSGTYMRIEVRHNDTLADDKETESMWSVLLPYLKQVEQLLTHFQGARVERLMECPKCARPSFLGEWLSPKDLQASTSRACDSCGVMVSTVYLIQPKEKKRDASLPTVEEFLLRKLKREAEKRQSEQSPPEHLPPVTEEAPAGAAMTNDAPDVAPVTKEPEVTSNQTALKTDPNTTDNNLNGLLFEKTEPPSDDCESKVQEDHVKNTNSANMDDFDMGFDEEQFLRELYENSLDTYIYDTASDKGRRKETRVTAVQTDW